MMSTSTCNASSLNIYIPSGSNPWDVQKIKHLYRRLGYGASLSMTNSSFGKNPAVLVDEIIDQALAISPTPAPDWVFKTYSDYPSQQAFDEANQQHINDSKYQFTVDILQNGFRSRMILFWMNHFVTQQEVYNCAGYLFQYYDVLQRNALGNFKEFTRAIGITPAMLHFLNGFDNTSEEPNENYARELYELFTLGENNGYTQFDIEETARALTGYNTSPDYCGQIAFNEENTFDTTEKTIFGRKGNWGYDDVIDILFEEKGALISRFICQKLYAYFIGPDINNTIVNQLAEDFKAWNWEIEPVLRKLFKSEHFFDTANFGILVKSPIDLTHQFLIETEYPQDEDGFNTIKYIHYVLGQDIFQPVDVAGWQRNHDWINSGTLTGRWIMMEWVIYRSLELDQPKFRQFAKDISGNSKNPEVITRAMINHFTSKELASPEDYEVATTILKGEVPENYYTEGIWNLDYEYAHWQLLDLLFHIARMPEFQLK